MSTDQTMAVAARTDAAAPGRARALAVLALIALVFAVCWPTTASLVESWTDTITRNYTHGPVILLLAVWLVWRERRAAAAEPARPWLPGFAVLAAGLIGWLVALRSGQQIVHQAALPMLAAASVLAVFGWRVLRRLAFPLGWLYLAIPVWDVFLPMLNWISVMAVRLLLRIADLPVYFEKSTLVLPAGAFEIADGCSGLHFFIVALTISLFYGEMNRDSLRTRLRLVALALVMAMLCNWVRIFIIVLAGYLTDMQHPLVSDEHYTFGWYMFAGMMALYFLIVRRWVAPAIAAPPAAPRDAVAVPATAFAATCLLLALAALATLLDDNRAQPDALERVTRVEAHPASAQDWRPDYPGVDRESFGVSSAGGATVEVYVAGFQKQEQGKELAGFRTSLLGPGLRRAPGTQPAPVPWNEIAADDAGGGRSILWYAYRIDDDWYRGAFDMQLAYGLRSLAGDPASALIALRARCPAGDCAAARAALTEFARTQTR